MFSFLHSNTDVHDRPEIQIEFKAEKFRLSSRERARTLCLYNESPIIMRPSLPTMVPTGVTIKKTGLVAFILTGTSKPGIVIHTGLIDSGYQGEIQAIVINSTQSNITLFQGDLKLKLCAVTYLTPPILDESLLNAPHYYLDMGYDLKLPYRITVKANNKITVDLNAAIFHSSSYHPVVFGRSGLASRGIIVYPKIWRPNMKITIHNYTSNEIKFEKGSRICQVGFMHKYHQPLNLRHAIKRLRKQPFTPKGLNVAFITIANTGLPNRSSFSATPPVLPAPESLQATQNERGNKGFGSSEHNNSEPTTLDVLI